MSSPGSSNGQDGSAAGIYSQLYNAVGDKVGGEVLVNTVTANGQIDPTVAALSDGSYVIAWASALADASGSAVAFQRFSAAGAKVGVETLANTFTTGDQLAPAITSLTTGGFVIAWQSQLQDGSQLGIYAQRFSAAGAKVGTEIAVNTFTTGSQDSPAIASLASGAFVIVWQSASQDGSSLGVYAQRYNSSGVAVGGETLVNTVTSNTQSAPAVTSLTGGGYVVTWQRSQCRNQQLRHFRAAVRRQWRQARRRDHGQHRRGGKPGHAGRRRLVRRRFRRHLAIPASGRVGLRPLFATLRRQWRQGRHRTGGEQLHKQRPDAGVGLIVAHRRPYRHLAVTGSGWQRLRRLFPAVRRRRQSGAADDNWRRPAEHPHSDRHGPGRPRRARRK